MHNATAYHFQIGEFRAAVIGDGQAQFPPHPLYAVNASAEAVAAALAGHFLPTDLYTLQCNVLYVDNGPDKILVDTGAGGSLGPALGRLPANLTAAGIAPASITAVLLTHAHLDHVSGLVDEHGALRFPNARVLLAEAEWNFWNRWRVDLSSMPIDEAFRQNFVQAARRNLQPLAERLETFRPGAEVLRGVHALDAAGHSPGHTAFRIGSGAESLLHVGDVFHHAAFDLEHPDWATAFDQDAKQAYRTRRRILNQAVAEKSLVLAYHAPFPALGHVRAVGSHYGWEADAWRYQ